MRIEKILVETGGGGGGGKQVETVIIVDVSEKPLHGFMRAVHGLIESGVGSIILIAATVLSLALANYGIAIYSTLDFILVYKLL